MRFVDHEERDATSTECTEDVFAQQALRCDDDDVQVAPGRDSHRLATFAFSQRRLELPCGNRETAQLVALVTHQREERRDDDDELREKERGQLIRARLYWRESSVVNGERLALSSGQRSQ